jgi:hypothetical protein
MPNRESTPSSGNVFAYLERLMRFLFLLGHDIEISVKGKAKSRSVARLRVA